MNEHVNDGESVKRVQVDLINARWDELDDAGKQRLLERYYAASQSQIPVPADADPEDPQQRKLMLAADWNSLTDAQKTAIMDEFRDEPEA